MSLFVSNGPFAFARPRFVGVSIVPAVAADDDPPGRLELRSEAQSCDQSCSAGEKNENERLAAAPCLPLERKQRCGWAARSLTR